MTARDRILGRIRTSLDAGADDARRRTRAIDRITRHRDTLVPARARQPRPELLAQFRGFLEGQTAVVLDVASRDGVPAAVASYLCGAADTASDAPCHPHAVRFGADPRFDAMPWHEQAKIATARGPASPDDDTGLSYALAGIAETGTLVLASGADNPVTLGFLPATHIIVVDRATIVGSYEDAIGNVRAVFGDSAMPRTLNYISGPSRTADIGGRIVIGAHGPRRMCVLIVG
ncbi:MAG: LUD domain-containing protein [Hyphomicrobiaceae bacterium]|nr:LUD domain-containing protein [Hyphomicrobiaceae bacterium]